MHENKWMSHEPFIKRKLVDSQQKWAGASAYVRETQRCYAAHVTVCCFDSLC